MGKKNTLYARMITGELTPSEIKSLQKSGEWDEVKAIIEATNSIKLSKYDKDSEYKKLISRRKNKKTNTGVIKMDRRLKVAAGVLIIFGISMFFINRNTRVSTEYGNTLVYQFKDDTKATLNDGSKIVFNKWGWGNNREVNLIGEALFEVQKGSPFTVYTDIGQVEVLGTSFNVRSRENTFEVECYSGKVKVSLKKEEVILQKGQGVKFEEQELRSKKLEHLTPFWLNQVSRFDHENLNLVFEELERQYNVIVESTPLDKYFTGTFTHKSLDSALKQICTPMGLTYKMDVSKKKISISR